MRPRAWIVVAYDVVGDRSRARLARRLEALVDRVQKSVFEGPVPATELNAVRAAIREEIDFGTDTVRVFHLCARCRDATELFGTSPLIPPEAEDIIVD